MIYARFFLSLIFLLAGMFIFFAATVGVNRFNRAVNRIHGAAMGDTLGIMFTVLALFIWKGFCMASLKMIIIIVFFWLASPVTSHMLAALEKETDEEVKKMPAEHHENGGAS